MSAVSAIEITPHAESKSATVVGAAAVGEKVTVLIVGGASYIPAGLRIRLRRNSIDVARFPEAEGDAWAVANTANAVGVLDLNTTEAFAEFQGRSDTATLDFVLIVEMTDADSRTLRVSGRLILSNWPQVEGDTAPHSLTSWPDALAAVDAKADQTDAALAAHDHTTGKGLPILHSSLTGAGVRTHAEIDQGLATLAGNVVTLGSQIGQADDRAATNEALFAQHSHTGETGQGPKVSHSDLVDPAGVHALIESRLALVGSSVTQLNAYALANSSAIGDLQTRATALEGADTVLSNGLASLQADVTTRVSKATLANMPDGYTAPAEMTDGVLREVSEDMTFNEIVRFLATLTSDLKEKGVLR